MVSLSEFKVYRLCGKLELAKNRVLRVNASPRPNAHSLSSTLIQKKLKLQSFLERWQESVDRLFAGQSSPVQLSFIEVDPPFHKA